MKKLLLLITIVSVPALALVAGDKKAKTKIVPKGKTYVQLNAKNKEIARFKAGQNASAITDCAQIPCPGTFGSEVVCWKCVEHPITSGTTSQ
jgi:Na+-transporting NADH:ubiquinone oxidoreductase subunit NqrF